MESNVRYFHHNRASEICEHNSYIVLIVKGRLKVHDIFLDYFKLCVSVDVCALRWLICFKYGRKIWLKIRHKITPFRRHYSTGGGMGQERKGVRGMAERTIKTNLVLTGEDEYIASMEKLTAALRAASEAKKEFDALFGKAPDSVGQD